MTSDARTILRDALLLDERDRADIAAELLASLDEEPAVDEPSVAAAWAEELDRRAARYLSGEESVEDWGAVRDRVIAELGG